MKITVYTSPTCQPCKATKRKLAREGIEFDEFDLTADDAKLAELKALFGVDVLPMPVIEVDGQVRWAEYRPDLLTELIKEAKA